MPRSTNQRPSRPHGAFTIIELLVVISIIGILIGIVIHSVSGVSRSALQAKTRIQFNQWSTAIEAFRQEYGYYPNFTLFPTGKIDDANKTAQFVQTLSGRKLDGTPLVSGDPGYAAGNTKAIQFCSFGTNDMNPGNVLQDAFGNPAIVVLMDNTYDGLIKIGDVAAGADYASSPPVIGATGPIDGQTIRAGVILYSAGAGDTPVTSWE